MAAYNDRERSVPFGKRLSDPERVQHFLLLGELYKSLANANAQSPAIRLQIVAAVERERLRCEENAKK